MAGETTITIVGNLTADPELRTTSTGSIVVNFTIASTPSHYNKQTNQWDDDPTLFLRCNAWDGNYQKLATNIAQTLSKGMRVIARGNLTQRSYQAQNGENRTVYEMRILDIGPDLSKYIAVTEQHTSQPMSRENDPWAKDDEFGNPEF